jgi:hypothetical protein
MDGDFASRSAAGVRLAASPEGALIGVYEPGLIAVLRVPDLAPIAEIGVDGELGDNDVAFAGRRLIVASRSTAHTRIHVVDPTAQAGPTKLGEVVLAGAMHLAAVANAPGDLVAAICGDAAATYVVDLARRVPPLRIDRGPMCDVAWLAAAPPALKT